MDTPDSTTLRQCRTCGQVKPVSDFYLGRTGKPILDCKPCKIEKSKQYQLKNADKVRNNHRLWRERNAEYYREYHRWWRQIRPELASAAASKYAKTDKGKAARETATVNRRARERNAIAKITSAELESIRMAQTDKRGYLRCWWCGKVITASPHLDHKLALAAGGKHEIGNVCYSCPKCNMSKQTKTPQEWAGRLL